MFTMNNNILNLKKQLELLTKQIVELEKGNKVDLKIFTLPITSVKQSKKGKTIRNLIFNIINDKSLDHYNVIRAIFFTLTKNSEFKKFGKNKVIITMAKVNGSYYGFHHNVLINSKTTFEEFYDQIKDGMVLNYEDGYPTEIIPEFEVKVWNMDKFINKDITITKNAIKGGSRFKVNQVRSYSTKAPSRNSISPVVRKSISLNNFATTDIETINLNGKQVPVLITFASNNKSKHFLINHKLLRVDTELALSKLFKAYFNYVKNSGIEIIFVHNLGGFDGYYIYKNLINFSKKNPEKVSTIIDTHNRFINITYKVDDKHKIVWKDSLRIFPIKLDSLCKVFDVPGKISSYNINFNKLTLFNDSNLLNEFIEYGIQDSIALYQALVNAQKIYLDKYEVDITSILSTSTLSLKIFRQQFLDKDIIILKKSEDSFIRRGYFGGATDYYKTYAENVKCYDVNSLYPTEMLQPMPGEISKFIRNMRNINLDDFFGFALVEVTTPKGMLRPLLPYRTEDGKTIFPTGNWTGVYFSEELKAVVKHGYSVKLISGYEFTKVNLFNDYVQHFYFKKKHSEGSERFIAKMHLNQLYGIFGRKLEVLETINVKTNDIPKYLLTRIVKTIIEVNDDVSTLLVYNNIPTHILLKLNAFVKNKDTNFRSSDKMVKSNVSVAAAVTAYGRIHMIKYKLDDGLCYTDTDSIFTTTELDPSLVGKELGQMKDELDGNTIKEAYFLGIKKYGYYYINSNTDETITRSVFSGVERDSLTFEEVKAISDGNTITRDIPTRFYKSLTDLSVKIDATKVTIAKSIDKEVIKFQCIPKHINEKTLHNNNEILIKQLTRKVNKLTSEIYRHNL